MKASPSRFTRTAQVRDLMTERVFTLRATDDLEALYDLMDRGSAGGRAPRSFRRRR